MASLLPKFDNDREKIIAWGNAYAQIIRNGKGEVVALYPLMPNKMTVSRTRTDSCIIRKSFDEGAAAITVDEVISLVSALKSPYRRSAKSLMNDATAEEIELLTSPLDLAAYKTAITEALYKGTKRTIESEENSKNAPVG